MKLKDKVAVIYGTGGDVGSAVARAFAREGAKLFLSGRNLHKVEAVAAEVIGRGGVAEAAQIDALDEQAVENTSAPSRRRPEPSTSPSAQSRSSTRCRIGLPLLELSTDQFALPITTYTMANFLTARSAARRMIARRTGAILTIHRHAVSHGIPERR
jgi:NAD(P)-dependent dehydrogenase (short-subunit alcohol dehydrogenase family)